MSPEPTLGELLANLTEAVVEYQGVVNRMFAIHSERIDLCDRMVVELRDDTHESLAALSNRVEALSKSAATKSDLNNLVATYLPDRV